MGGRVLGVALAALCLAACATARPPPETVEAKAPLADRPAPIKSPEPKPRRAAEPDVPSERILPLTALRGWEGEDHAAALAAFRSTCGAARNPALSQICRDAQAIGPLDRDQSRRFFEAHFRAEQTRGEGVLTAYFAPEYPARR